MIDGSVFVPWASHSLDAEKFGKRRRSVETVMRDERELRDGTLLLSGNRDGGFARFSGCAEVAASMADRRS